MPDVFISYSRRDLEFGKKLHQVFTSQGKDVWMDWEDIPLSSDWWTEIQRGIDTADNFLLIMSPDSIGSPVCQLEIEHARQMNKRIVPIFHRPVDNAQAINDVLERIQKDEHLKRMMGSRDARALFDENNRVLATINWVFFKPEDAFEEKFHLLSQVLEADLTHVRQHTRLQMRALEWQNHERNISFVISGDELDAAQQWLAGAAGKQPAPTPLHQTFIQESERVERNRHRLVRLLLTSSAVLGVMIVVAMVAVVLAITRANAAQSQADLAATQVLVAATAERSAEDSASFSATRVAVAGATLTPIPPTMTAVAQRIEAGERRAEQLRLAGEAYGLALDINGNPEIASLLALRSLKIGYSPEADRALIQSIQQLQGRLILEGDTDDVTTAAYNPDSTIIVTGSTDGTLRFRSAEDGATLRVQAIPAGVNHVQFNPDGTRLLAAFNDRVAREYDAATGELLRTLSGHTAIVWWVRYSPDGRLMATASEDRTARLWDAATGELLFVLRVGSITYSLDFSPDSAILATGSQDGVARLWDTTTGELVDTLLDPEINYGFSYAIAFHPSGEYLAVSYSDLSVRLWELATGSQALVYLGHFGYVNAIDFTGDGREMVTASDDFTVRVWEVGDYLDLGDGLGDFSQIVEYIPLLGHTDRVYDVRFSQDDSEVLTASLDNTARVWQMNFVDPVRYVNVGEGVLTLSFSPDGRYLGLGTDYGEVLLREVATGELIRSYEGHTDWVERVTFSPDGRTLASASDDRTIRLWEVQTGEELAVLEGHTSFVYGLRYSPDGTLLVSSSDDGTIKLWDVARQQLIRTLEDHTASVNDVRFSPDGTLIASASSDYTVKLWQVDDGRLIRTFTGHTDYVNRVTFSPDGQTLASASHDFTVRLWDVASGETTHTLTGHRFWVMTLAFSPDGRTLATGSADNTARLWDMDTLEAYRILEYGQQRITSVVFHPDGKTLLTADFAGNIVTWDTDYRDFVAYACQRLLRDFSPQERTTYGMDATPTCTDGP
ncbi:MAG: TIR domain-containing protein [Anaerolineae bacterium]|nr:TIR domain-containing protein [Anaerolineae bacterium]